MTPARLERLIECLGRLDPRNGLQEPNEWLDPAEPPFTTGEIRAFLAERLPHTKLTTATPEQVEAWSDALADCACWFRGFRAATGDDADGMLPPAYRTLTDINLAMKQHLAAWSEADHHRPTGVTQ